MERPLDPHGKRAFLFAALSYASESTGLGVDKKTTIHDHRGPSLGVAEIEEHRSSIKLT